MKCPKCHGAGQTQQGYCWACNGSGQAPKGETKPITFVEQVMLWFEVREAANLQVKP